MSNTQNGTGKTLFSSGSTALVANVVQQFLSMVQFLLLVRMLVPAELGIWALYITLITISETAKTGLIQNGLIRFLNTNPESEKTIIASSLWLTLVAGSAFSLILPVLTLPLLWFPKYVLLWQISCFYPIYGFFCSGSTFLAGCTMARNDFRLPAISNFISGMGALIPLYLYRAPGSLNLIELVSWQCIIAAVTTVLLWKISRIKVSLKNRDKEWVSKLFHFGKYIVATNGLSILFQRIDLLIIGATMNPASVAIYNAGSRIGAYLDLPLNSLSQALFPNIASACRSDNKDTLPKVYEQSVGILLAITLPPAVLLFFIAKPVLLLLAGPTYTDASVVLQLFAISSLIKPWGRVFGMTLDASGMPGKNSMILLLSACLNLSLNLLLIPFFGYTGAALAGTLSTWVVIPGGQLFMRKKIDITPLNAFKHIFPVYLNGWKKAGRLIQSKI